MSWMKKQLRSLYKRRLRWWPGSSFSRNHPSLARWRTRFLEWLVGDPVPVQGLRMRLDWPDSLGLRRSEIYEPLETAVVLALIRPGMQVLDLGANIGYYTLLMARATGPEGRVWAFEPDPDNYALLTANVALNGFSHVTAFHAAAAAAPGRLALYRSAENRGDNRIFDDGGGGHTPIEVEASPVDALLPSGTRLDLVKMDIQGAEAHALAGMTRLLANSPEVVILTEYWPEAILGVGSDPERFLTNLTALGFQLYLLGESHGRPAPQPTDPTVLTRERCRGGVNLLASRTPLGAVDGSLRP